MYVGHQHHHVDHVYCSSTAVALDRCYYGQGFGSSYVFLAFTCPPARSRVLPVCAKEILAEGEEGQRALAPLKGQNEDMAWVSALAGMMLCKTYTYHMSTDTS